LPWLFKHRASPSGFSAEVLFSETGDPQEDTSISVGPHSDCLCAHAPATWTCLRQDYCLSFSARTSRDVGKDAARHIVIGHHTSFESAQRITGCWLFQCPWKGRTVWNFKRIKII